MLPIIGLKEKISFVDAKIADLDCKIDTGADTSSVHCERIRVKEINGVDYLVFKLLDKKHPQYSDVELRTKNFIERKIKSAVGDYEYRYQVKLKIKFENKIYLAKFNLANRSHMSCPVLIGRKFLTNKFLVDVSR